MTGPETAGDVAVILGALVDIVDDEGDRRPGRHALEYARENAYLIGLLPLGREARLARPAAIEPGLYVGFG